MRLFRSDNETGNRDLETKVIRDKNKVVVISGNPDVSTEISSILRMHNISNVISKNMAVNDFREDDATFDAGWYILDIEGENDIAAINDIIVLAIPNDAMYILIGETDSISFSSELLKFGAKYLLKESQLGAVADIILNTKGMQVDRHSLNVSFLGCKGGCGTTTISSSVFSSVENFINTPTLFVQGASGSCDLDLIAEDNYEISILENKIQKINASKFVKIDNGPIRFDYNNNGYQQYNVNFFDHNINRASPEELDVVFTNSSVMILVVGNNFSSFRTAKKIIDEYIKFESRSKSRPKRTIICLNEYSVNVGRDKFSDEDIEEFLGKKIDLRFPNFNSDKNKKIFNRNINNLSSLIFAKEINKGVAKKGLLSWIQFTTKS
ncbi:hypothetical protein ACFLXR_004502 [Salmonella enterica]